MTGTAAEIATELDRLGAEIVHVGLFDYATMFHERRMRREDLLAGADTAVFANVSYGSTAAGQLFSAANEAWSMGGAVAETLFDGGLRRAQVGAARATYD